MLHVDVDAFHGKRGLTHRPLGHESVREAFSGRSTGRNAFLFNKCIRAELPGVASRRV